MSKPALFYSDHHALPLPEGHKFPSGKYALLRDLLQEDDLFQLERSSAPPRDVLELAHDKDYVRQFIAGELPPSLMRRIGLPWSEALVRRATVSVGGTLAAADRALNFGWGATLGGGTHHAFRSEGAGFCIFNDIAVAIQYLRASGLIRRAAVIDLDVHQGDGTAEIFCDDPEVFTLSIHCQSNFPFRKKQSSLDLGLPDRVADEEYLLQLDSVLPQVFAFRPDIVFYQSGVDGLSTDALGHLSLTPAGLVERDRRVLSQVRDLGIPLALTSGGGYSRPIELSAQAHANTYRTAYSVLFATQAEAFRASSGSDILV